MKSDDLLRKPSRRSVAIRSIGTAVPATMVEQSRLRDLFASQQSASRLTRRLVTSVFNASSIDRRYTVIDELGGPVQESSSFIDDATGSILSPTTGQRNDVYSAAARPLLASAALRAIEDAQGLENSDVTHVITVSCTGFFAPGPDYALVRELGLAPSTRRLHIGFMGCYGAFPALRAAVATCLSEPDAVVLIACVELCSLHIRASDDPDTIVASSVFADGAAAAVITARTVPPGAAVLEIDALETLLTDGGEEDMAWTIGDHGFEMVLSSYVPRILEAQIKGALQPLLDHPSAENLGSWPEVDKWAVHPGGRAILDRVQKALGLSDHQMGPSRRVLRDFGNMSSATILFILRDLLAEDEGHLKARTTERIAAMAFGPGLTVESGLFTRRIVS